MTFKIFFHSLLLTLITSSTFAQSITLYSLRPSESKTLITLERAIEKALEYNEDFLISGKNIDAERGRRLQAISTLLPHLRLLGSYTQQWPAITNVEYGQLTGAMQGTFSVFDLSNIGRVHNATPLVNQQKLINQRAKATLIRDVSLAYLFAVARQKVADLARNYVERLQEQESSSLKRLEAGTVRKLDAQRASLLVLDAQNKLAEALVVSDHALAFLGFLIGKEESFELENTKHIEAIESDFTAHDFVSVAQHERLDFRAQQLGVKIAKQNYRIDWFGFFPKLDFIGNLSIGTPLNVPPSIMLNASMPLFEGGVQFGRLKVSKAFMAQETLRLRQLHRRIDGEVRGALDEVSLKKVALNLAQSTHDLSKAMSNNATRLFEQGQASGLELSEANRNLYDAQVGVEQALLGLDEARLNLMYFTEKLG